MLFLVGWEEGRGTKVPLSNPDSAFIPSQLQTKALVLLGQRKRSETTPKVATQPNRPPPETYTMYEKTHLRSAFSGEGGWLFPW